ncbi:m-AAA protease-interacting protein 1, mitochondrial-like [Hetaerina americana]|uniref:m-AAA protease-interacting protein 1, mitochondrial-like n=1 Tax=Hetaerina americana TaxID=62018 RepID=UPI003A7F1023
MQFQAVLPILKYVKMTNSGLKCLLTREMLTLDNFRVSWFEQSTSFLSTNLHAVSARSFSLMACAHNLASTNNCSSLYKNNPSVCIRGAHNDRNNDNSPTKSLVLYIQNPVRWLVNKLDFSMLRRAWDPNFRENEFKNGAKQAVSSITHLMSSNNFEDLEGLLTSPAINQLRREVETKWSDVQRRNFCLNKDDIKVALPQRVRFQRIDERRFCDVDMLFLALKQSEYEGKNATIFMEIKVRFHRDYTEGLDPEWTVSMFKVTRFNILSR